MPRRKNEPRLYLPVVGTLAMMVLPPYKEVAEWCGGKVVMNGVKFSHIEVQNDGEIFRAPEGSYIIADRAPFTGDVRGYYSVGGHMKRMFEKSHREAGQHECK